MIEIIDTKCHPTSSIRASCGDDITNKLAFSICIKDRSIDYGAEKFVNSITYMTVCFKCFIYYLVHGLVIFTEKSTDKWLYRRIK